MLIVLILLAALPVLTYPLGRDQGEFATIGRGLLNGRIPYVELWNPKPPAVFYVYAGAMALFGQTSTALRALDLLIFPVIGAALAWLGARFATPRVGLWAVLLFGVFYFTETFWTLTQNDGIVLLPMILAVVCMVKAADGTTRAALWALLCGALCAWALWFKYPFALFVLAVMIGYALLRRGRLDWRAIAAFVIGGLVVGVGGIAALASQGALDALVESATVTSQYTALGFNLDDFTASMTTALGFRWSHWGLLFMLVALWPVLANLTPQPPLHNERGGEIQSNVGTRFIASARPQSFFLWLWLIAALAIMLIQAKGYDYHWLPLLPPMALLGAMTLEMIFSFSSWRSLRPGGSMVFSFALLSVLFAVVWGKSLPYLTGQEDQKAYYSRFQGGEFVADESLAVAEYLQARVAPGDSLFIWGFRPEVYYLSRLNPATRFIFQFPLVADWYPVTWRQQTVDTLWAAMPPYALVLQVDYMPWVTGKHEDSNTLLQAYTEMNNWLIANYEREAQIGNFFIWRRKT